MPARSSPRAQSSRRALRACHSSARSWRSPAATSGSARPPAHGASFARQPARRPRELAPSAEYERRKNLLVKGLRARSALAARHLHATPATASELGAFALGRVLPAAFVTTALDLAASHDRPARGPVVADAALGVLRAGGGIGRNVRCPADGPAMAAAARDDNQETGNHTSPVRRELSPMAEPA